MIEGRRSPDQIRLDFLAYPGYSPGKQRGPVLIKLIALVVILGLAGACDPTSSAYVAEKTVISPQAELSSANNYCPNKYSDLLQYNAIVCSRSEISTSQMAKLRHSIEKTFRLYPVFAAQHNIVFKQFPGKYIKIVFLTADELNDKSIFKDMNVNNAIARYFPGSHMLYITDWAFDIGDLNLPHELVHCLNEYNASLSNAQDEKVAYAFEAYYMAH